MSAATLNSSNNNPWPSLTEVYNDAKAKHDEEGEGWEILADEHNETNRLGHGEQSSTSQHSSVDEEHDYLEVGIHDIPENPKILHHCASSPDLRFLSRKMMASTGDNDSSNADDLESSPVVVSMPGKDQREGTTNDDNSSSITDFTLAESPSIAASATTATSWGVVSSSMQGGSSTVKRVPSFKDIIVLQQQKEREELEQQQQQQVNIPAPEKKSPRKFKAKFEVVPIDKSRIHNSKSTGDLLSLIVEEEEDDGGGGGGGEILGATDAMDYYHRKGKGAVSHKAGLRSRPDEAKRKAISVAKKDLQRQKQQEKQQQQQEKPKSSSSSNSKSNNGGGGGRKKR